MITSYAAGYAVVWYITETTGSALMLSAAAICAYLPQGLLSPFGGVIADKHNRKTVMIVADLGVGLVSLGLGVAILLGQVSFALLMILVIVRSIGQAFHGPAMMAAMPLLVPEKHLLRINTLDQLLMSVASIGAPAFGIFLYTTLGFHTVMFLDFFGALAAVAGLALAKIPTVIDKAAEHVLANLRDGWRALSANRGLVILIAGVTVGMVAFAPGWRPFPLFDHFGGDGYAASLVEAAFGIGMVVRLDRAHGLGRRQEARSAHRRGGPYRRRHHHGLRLLSAGACSGRSLRSAPSWRSPAPGSTGRSSRSSSATWPRRRRARRARTVHGGYGLGLAHGHRAWRHVGGEHRSWPFFVVDGAICLVLGLVVYLPKSVRALDHAPAVQPETAGGQTAEAEA
ncbi:MAG: MFS transporter [Gordonibacter pamelaeae]